MAVQIQMAEPADLAGIYLKGQQTRAEIQQASQRLAQQQQEIAMRAQQESQQRAQQAEQFNQEQQVAQQRIQVEKAYHDQQIAIQQQDLAQAAKMDELKTATAARQFETRQQWQQGFEKIDNDPALNDEQKDKAKTAFTMRLAPMMGIPGNEASAMLRDLRPAKATVPASVDSESDPNFAIVHQPNGSIAMHPKPKAGTGTEPSVKVRIPDPNHKGESLLTTMPRSQALQTIARLPQEWKTNEVNRAVVAAAPKTGPQQFKKGDQARQNGVVYEYDGQTWNPADE